MFVVGQRIVAIYDFGSAPYGEAVPIKGTVYTVRELWVSPRTSAWGVRLCEIVNPLHAYSVGICEQVFEGNRFRPVDETKIDLFRELLAPTPTERVDA